MDLEGAVLVEAKLGGARLVESHLNGIDGTLMDLARADLSNATFEGAFLYRMTAPGACFDGSRMSGARLWAASLEEASFRGATLAGAFVDGARLDRCEMAQADLRGLRARQVILDGAGLEGADLSEARLPRASLRGARLRGARLQHAFLTGADLRGADLRDADLRGARMDRVRLTGALLEGARLEEVTAAGLRVSWNEPFPALARRALERGGASFEMPLGLRILRSIGASIGALGRALSPYLTMESFRRLLGSLRRTVLRSLPHLRIASRRLFQAFLWLVERARQVAGEAVRSPLEDIGPGADLRGRDFSGFQLAGLDLHGADLRGARLVGVDLTGADLSDVNLSSADLTGSLLTDVNLSGSNLVGAVLHHAVLRNVVFTGAVLARARFNRSEMRGASLRGVDAAGASFEGAALVRSSLDGANLEGASFFGADLTGATLREARLRGAVFGPEENLNPALRELTLTGGARIEHRTVFQPLLDFAATFSSIGARLPRLGLVRIPWFKNLFQRAGTVGADDAKGADPQAEEQIRRERDERERMRLARTEEARRIAEEKARRREEDRNRRRQESDERRRALEGFGPSILVREESPRLDESQETQPSPGADEIAASVSVEELAPALIPETLQEITAPSTEVDTSAEVPFLRLELEPKRDGVLLLPPPRAPVARESTEDVEERLVELAAEPELGFQAGRRWFAAGLAAASLGLGLFLALRFLGPGAVSDVSLEEEATAAALSGDPSRAAVRYLELAERAEDPKGRAEWLVERASALERSKDLGGAIQALEPILTLDLEDEDLLFRARLKLGGLLLLAGRTLDALTTYEAIVEEPAVPPEHLATALIGLGDAHAALGFQERGREVQRMALSRFPRNPEVSLAVARRMSEALLARDRGQEAFDILAGVPGDNLEPTERAIWYTAQAQVLDVLGNSTRALEYYDAALALLDDDGPLSLSTRYRIARLRYARGDLAPASLLLEGLDNARTSPDIRARSLLLRAEILRRRAEYQDAEALCHRVIAEFPEDQDAVEEARAGLGALALAVGGPEAIAALREQLERDGKERQTAADVLLGFAAWSLERSDPEAALEIYDSVAARFDPRERWGLAALQGRASALFDLARTNEAIEVLRLVRTQVAGVERLRVDARLGDAYLKAGQIDEAELAFKSLVEITGGEGEIGLRAEIGLAQVAEARGQMEAAVAQYTHVLDKSSDPGIQGAALQALAGLFLESGKEAASLDAWRRFVELTTPGSPVLGNARLAMAELYAKAGESEREREVLSEIITQDPNPSSVARARLRIAELKLQTGSNLEALADFELLASEITLPSDLIVDAAFGRASALNTLGRYSEALAVVSRAIDASAELGENSALMSAKRQALLGLGREEEADALLASLKPEEGEASMAAIQSELDRAVQLRDAGRLLDSLELYRRVLPLVEDRPAQSAILRDMALVQAGMGENAAARASLERMASDYGDIAESRFMSGFTLAEMDLAEGDADSALRRLLALEAPDEGHRLWHQQALARAREASGDIDGARKAWRDILEYWPADPLATATAWSGLGELFLREGEKSKAIAAFQRSVALAPTGSQRDHARLRVIAAYLEMGDLDQSLELIEEMRRESKTLESEASIQLHLTWSGVLQEKGEWAEALEAVDDLPAKELGADWSSQIVETRAVCLIALKRFEEAEKAYRALVEAWPNSAEVAVIAQMGLANVASAQGETDLAVERLTALARTAGDRFRQAEALLRLGQVLEEAGRREEARAAWGRVVEEYREQRELAEVASRSLEE